jgi:hypothetical protein
MEETGSSETLVTTYKIRRSGKAEDQNNKMFATVRILNFVRNNYFQVHNL